MILKQISLVDIIVLAVIVIAPFVLPEFSSGEQAGVLITATSALFAIVVGFFISDAMSNYLRLQTLISEENAALISLASLAGKIDAKHAVQVHDAIDRYMIAQLNYGSLNHLSQTEAQIILLNESVDELRVKAAQSELFDHVLAMQEKLRSCRQEISIAGKKNLTSGHWALMTVLACLVGVSLLAVRDGSLFFNIVTIVMTASIFGVLILLREMDNNFLLEQKIAFDNPIEVFDAIGRPPFYPHNSSESERLPNSEGIYRACKSGKLHALTCEIEFVHAPRHESK